MLFNSLEFAVFFPVVATLYFLSPFHWRTPLLLVASCAFYMAFIPAYILILGVTIVVDYTAGIYLERTHGRRRLALLWVSVAITCLVLFIFKYFNFFTDTFLGIATHFGWQPTNPSLDIILPIGLSFHTFQSLSYVFEVYRGRQRAEHDFTTYATYVMFFPQLVAGPIERPQNLLPEFHERHYFDYVRVTSGLKRMAWGFFKKLVVADRLALYVNDVYSAPQEYNGLQLTIATFFFAYQIYCDFSGYSDIAIGSARVLGFRLMENFETPYHSASISEFWRRWHISLSTWFRDYVYFPLGGNRVKPARWFTNILLTFGISGLWHGANWTYVVWGLLNGFYLIAGTLLQPLRQRIAALCRLPERNPIRLSVGVVTTFGLVCIAWVFFRAPTLADAFYIFSHMWRDWDFSDIGTEQFLLRQMPLAIAAILLLEAGEWLRRRMPLGEIIPRFPMPVRWFCYATALMVVVMFGVYSKSQFIYFQF